MIIEINGKSLSNNFDMFLYYEEIVGRDLMLDLTLRSKKLQVINGKTEIADEEIIKEFKIIDFTFNLYYAARCAFENRLIDRAIAKEEMTTDLMLSDDCQRKLFSLIGSKKK